MSFWRNLANQFLYNSNEAPSNSRTSYHSSYSNSSWSEMHSNDSIDSLDISFIAKEDLRKAGIEKIGQITEARLLWEVESAYLTDIKNALRK